MALGLQSLIGIVGIPLLAWLASTNRAALPPRRLGLVVAAGLGAQMLIALVLLKLPQAAGAFDVVTRIVRALQRSTEAGVQMVFGHLAGGPPPYSVDQPQNTFVLALNALPLILILSALTRVLYHWGVLQRVVGGFAAVFQRTFGIGGPLATVAAAKIFLGMVEAPLLVRPYLATMGRGALFAAMTLGMATIAGTVMALYALILDRVLPQAAGHVLAASLMNAPAALMLACLVVPDGFSEGPRSAEIRLEHAPRSTMDAIAQGTVDGLKLLAAVIAMLVVMVALVSLVNELMSLLGEIGGRPVTLQRLLGYLCAPIAFAIGIPWSEALTAGSLIGQKIVLNEFLAFLDLARMPTGLLSERSRLILTYGLCGFANLGSLGIMVGGLTAMVPERRADIIELAPRAMVLGALATLLSGAVVAFIGAG